MDSQNWITSCSIMLAYFAHFFQNFLAANSYILLLDIIEIRSVGIIKNTCCYLSFPGLGCSIGMIIGIDVPLLEQF